MGASYGCVTLGRDGHVNGINFDGVFPEMRMLPLLDPHTVPPASQCLSRCSFLGVSTIKQDLIEGLTFQLLSPFADEAVFAGFLAGGNLIEVFEL